MNFEEELKKEYAQYILNHKNKMTNKNTTMKMPKELRDDLAVLKFKYHMDELYQVVQLLYNIKDDSVFKEQVKEINNENI